MDGFGVGVGRLEGTDALGLGGRRWEWKGLLCSVLDTYCHTRFFSSWSICNSKLMPHSSSAFFKPAPRLGLASKQLHLPIHRSLRQSRTLLLEQLLRLLPNPHTPPLPQPHQTRQKRRAKRLARLPRQQRRQVINTDHAQWQLRRTFWQLDGYSGLGEGGVDVVDGDRIVRVRGVAGDVADDGEFAGRGGEGLGVDEGRDFGGEVDAVYENVGVDYFGVGTGFGGGFGEVPFLREQSCVSAR